MANSNITLCNIKSTCFNNKGGYRHLTRVVKRGGTSNNSDGYDGVACSNTNNDSSNTNTNNGSRLALKKNTTYGVLPSTHTKKHFAYPTNAMYDIRCTQPVEPSQTIMEGKNNGIRPNAFSRAAYAVSTKAWIETEGKDNIKNKLFKIRERKAVERRYLCQDE